METRPLVSIITATLNEKGNVPHFVDRVKKSLRTIPYEIIVVDDNSKDGTIELLERMMSKDSNFHAIINSRREGLLKSNLRGLKASGGNIRIVMDSDLQHPPEVLGELVKSFDSGRDCVVMSRFVKGGLINRRDAYRASVTSFAISLCHLFVPQTRGFKDPISGFFAIGKNVNVPYEKLYKALGNGRGYKVLVPIIANNVDRKFSELPYYFDNRFWGESKIGKENLLIPRYLRELSQYRILFKRTAF